MSRPLRKVPPALRRRHSLIHLCQDQAIERLGLVGHLAPPAPLVLRILKPRTCATAQHRDPKRRNRLVSPVGVSETQPFPLRCTMPGPWEQYLPPWRSTLPATPGKASEGV